jgi:hypothetical protein
MYTKKPDINNLKEIAKEVNATPLANIPDTPQILLPPPEHSLIRNNFQVYSEDILHGLTNQNVKQEQTLEEEFGIMKRHSMIGLKRRDYDDRHNVVLNKKKMRLSGSNEDDMSFKRFEDVAGDSNQKKTAPKVSQHHQSHNNVNNINNVPSSNKSANKLPNEDDYEGDLFDNEDEDSMSGNQPNFYMNNGNQDEDDYNNYYDNFS